MTRRERLENKLAKREEWAAKANTRSDAAANTAHDIGKNIPLAQPNIGGKLTGVYHRIENAMDRSVTEYRKAEHHKEKADWLSRILDNTIFDDDPDAIEKIEQKISRLENEHAYMLAVNKICRNKKFDETAKIAALVKLGVSEESAHGILKPEYSWQSVGFESWALSNNSANIRRYKDRLETIKAKKERQIAAENAANGVLIQEKPFGYVVVTFAEKPDYSVIDALKTAGFRWCKSYWYGKKETLPAEVKNLMKGE